MKKYLFAGLAFLGGFIIIVFAQAIIYQLCNFRLGGIFQGAWVVILFAVTAAVFRRSDRPFQNRKKAAASNELSKNDIQHFKKVFPWDDIPFAGITEIMAGYGKRGVSDFVIFLRTDGIQKIDTEAIKKELHAIYDPNIVFVFIILQPGEADQSGFMKNATVIFRATALTV